MKITAWTNENYAREHFIDLFDKRLKLLNPNKKEITPTELSEMAKSKGISNEEMFRIWRDEYEKIPTFIDENKAKEYANILLEIEKCVIEHCREKGIRFSADYHQYGDYGIPIIDDRLMYMGFARTWGWIMAMADGDFSDKGYLRYYLYANENPNVYPNEIEGEKTI